MSEDVVVTKTVDAGCAEVEGVIEDELETKANTDIILNELNLM